MRGPTRRSGAPPYAPAPPALLRHPLVCLREADSRDTSLRDLRWLAGTTDGEPTFVRVEGNDLDAAVQAVHAAAARVDPGLIVISNDHWSPWHRGGSGLVTRIVRGFDSPVYVVPRPGPGRTVEPRPRRILVPLDGTERAAAALPLVEQLALVHGSEVFVARVERRGLERPMLAMQLTRERVLETLAPWVERLARAGVPVTALVGYGCPPVELQALAARHSVDLLAMTTSRARGGLLERWFARSVFDELLRRTSLPLLAVPAPLDS